MPRNARPCEYLDVPANKVWGFFRGGENGTQSRWKTYLSCIKEFVLRLISSSF